MAAAGVVRASGETLGYVKRIAARWGAESATPRQVSLKEVVENLVRQEA